MNTRLFTSESAEDVHRLSAHEHEYQCAGNGQGHGEHDDEGVLETLELSRQNQVDEHQGKAEGEEQA